jgi:tRNA(fMet)-specific endonuclease VapC
VNLLMLDTDISSYVIRRRPPGVAEHFARHAEQLCVSAMTAAELRFGAAKAGRPELTSLIEAYLSRLTILDWGDPATFHYARIRTELERLGTPIGNMDLLIACHAVAERATLVTNNVKHFSAVRGLKVEQWKT